ncbi:MAG: glycine cleavage system aminomethyltransferase GcvT [Chloroflexota bacterium]
MTEATEATAHQTPLADRHAGLGARMIEFAGWLMPVQYGSIVEEHRMVRERVGLFDLSHMGELFVDGAEAGEALARALVTNPPALREGRAHYSMMCEHSGGIIDDLIVYRLGPGSFLVVANASNATVDSDELAERIGGSRAVLDDRSLATGLVAIQGPRSVDVLSGLTDTDVAGLHYYGVVEGHVAGIRALIARTGYTGEDGFELFVDWERTGDVWDVLLERVREAGGGPVGLGARDTLRLEAGMPLYGNELGRDTNPYEAGQGRIVRLDKPADFVGRAALEKVARDGPAKRLVGLQVRGRGIARHGYPVHLGDRKTGVVTSGTLSPTLGSAIAMAYVAPADAAPGTIVDVEIRDARVPAEVVALPFYHRAR